jgi:tight adherence protein B
MLTLSMIFVAFALLSGLYTVISYFSDRGKRRMAKRVKRIVESGRHDSKATSRGQLRQAQSPMDQFMQRIVPRPEALRARLASAGMSASIGQYVITCAGIALVAIVLAVLKGLSPVLALFVGLAIGVALPYLWVGHRIGARRGKFVKLFPDAVALMARGLKAGLPFTDTLLVVAREIADPVGEECRRMSDQIKLGQPLEEAMWAVSRRIQLPEFNFLITTLSVQRETGGNLAATLENLEEMLRKRQQMRMKVKAMSSEAKASAGIIGAMPFVMASILYVVSPEYIMRLFTTNSGHFMLGMGLCSLIAGVYMMTRMVRFDI